MKSVLIIAEAGVNHNGRMDLARRLVKAASAAGADVVKFQTFKTELCMTVNAAKAEYQQKETGAKETQFDMVKKLELRFSAFKRLSQECKRSNILFCSTPFDLESIDFLHSLTMPFWKIPSGEITNLPYLRKIAQFGEPVVMSTGMATLDEIRAACRVLRAGGVSEREITLLHCHTDYPTRFEDANLRAIQTLRHKFPRCRVGYSDHTVGLEAPLAAVALGAEVIEKHFTLSRRLSGPDHKASLEPDELRRMVQAIRHLELALGDGIKRPRAAELKNRSVARKSIVALRAIRAGERFTVENLTVKRPGGGVDPMQWDAYLRKTARRNYQPDELIDA